MDLSAPGRNAHDATVAMGNAGGTAVVWRREGTTPFNGAVQAAVRDPGGAFSAPVDLAVPAQDPRVAMTPGGEAIAAWWRSEGSTYALQVSARPPGGSFSPPVDVAMIPTGASPGRIELAVNASGDTALAWIDRDFPELTPEEEEENEEKEENEEPVPSVSRVPFVKGSVRPAGGAFSEPKAVSPLPLRVGKSATEPSVAIDAGGDATFVWGYSDETDRVIQASTRPAGEDFLPFEAVSDPGGVASSPDVGMDSAGNAIAVWTRFDGDDFIAQASIRPPEGEFAPPVDELSPIGANAGSPQIAVAPGGTATVIWNLSTAEAGDVQSTTRPPGGSFTPAEDISVPGEEPIYPRLALNQAGDALVTWSGLSQVASRVVRGVIRPAAGEYSAPVVVSASDSAFFPEGAIDLGGNATVVWDRSNGTHDIVQAAGYDADPPQFRGVSIPAQGTVGVPVGFSADPFDVWPIASTVFSFGDGATGVGTAVSHVYAAPGSYPVTVTSADPAGSTVSTGGTISIAPIYGLKLGKHKRNRKRGIVRLTVIVPGPGKVVVRGRGVKRKQRRAAKAGRVTIPVISKGKWLKRLNRKGKARIRVIVSFTPDGGDHSVNRRPLVVLIKKIKRPNKQRSR